MSLFIIYASFIVIAILEKHLFISSFRDNFLGNQKLKIISMKIGEETNIGKSTIKVTKKQIILKRGFLVQKLYRDKFNESRELSGYSYLLVKKKVV